MFDPTEEVEYTSSDLFDMLKTRKAYMLDILNGCVKAVESTNNAIIDLRFSDMDEDTLREALYDIITEYNNNIMSVSKVKKSLESFCNNIWSKGLKCQEEE